MDNKCLICENCGRPLHIQNQVCQVCEPELLVNKDASNLQVHEIKKDTISPVSTRLQIWLVVIWFGLPFFWSDLSLLFSFEASYPLAGARGLLDGKISGLLFFLTLGFAIALSIRKYYVPSTLFFCGGMLVAASIGLSFYVANSGFIIPWFAGIMLFREGKCSLTLYKNT